MKISGDFFRVISSLAAGLLRSSLHGPPHPAASAAREGYRVLPMPWEEAPDALRDALQPSAPRSLRPFPGDTLWEHTWREQLSFLAFWAGGATCRLLEPDLFLHSTWLVSGHISQRLLPRSSGERRPRHENSLG